MKQHIEIGGRPRALLFGFACLYEYEQGTGRNALSDFRDIESGNGRVSVIVDLVYSGICAGCRSDGTNVDFTKHDVAEWIGEPGVLERVMKAFSESFDAGNRTPGPTKVMAAPAK